MAKKCTGTNDLYDNVEFCPGEVTLPGMKEFFFFIRRNKIVIWPTLPMNSAESLEKNPVYDGDFVLAADAKWKRVDLIPNESEPQSERTGAYGSYHFNNKASLVIPGTGPKVTGLINELINDDVVMALPQRDGRFRIFGNKDFKLDVNPTQKWGKATTDSNNTTLEVTDENRSASPFYDGKIEADDGNYSGKTGELIVDSASKPASSSTGSGS